MYSSSFGILTINNGKIYVNADGDGLEDVVVDGRTIKLIRDGTPHEQQGEHHCQAFIQSVGHRSSRLYSLILR